MIETICLYKGYQCIVQLLYFASHVAWIKPLKPKNIFIVIIINSQICNSQNILMVCNGMGERITDKNLFEPGVWLTEFLLKWCLTLEDQHPQALFPGRS